MSPEGRLRLGLVAFAVVIVVGFFGYQLVAGFSPLDALYMTVITVTTVGFSEIEPLGQDGRVFTIGIIAAGVVSVGLMVTGGGEFVLEGHMRRIIERRRMNRSINHLNNHIIICGFGRVGRQLAEDLEHDHVPFVFVDVDRDRLAEADEHGYPHVDGDASEESVLADAGIERARALVACVNSDADNVLITLTAKGMRPDLTVIGRAKVVENGAKFRRAGADRVIAPTTIGGRRIAQLLTRPVVADFLEQVSGAGGLEYSFEEIAVSRGSELVGVQLRDADLRERWGCTVLAIARAGQPIDTHPESNCVLESGDVLVVIGTIDELNLMRDHFAGR